MIINMTTKVAQLQIVATVKCLNFANHSYDHNVDS